jgi:hypothetical protein
VLPLEQACAKGQRYEFAVLKSLLWPPASPPALGVREPHDRVWWVLTCTLLALVLTAVAHHAIFYPHQCMLESFGADYSDSGALATWLSQDPSLPSAIAITFLVFFAGKQFPSVKILAACFFVSLLPLALWIWDIPFTRRFICVHAHDDRLTILGWPVKSSHLYMLGAISFGGFCLRLWRNGTFRQSFESKNECGV